MLVILDKNNRKCKSTIRTTERKFTNNRKKKLGNILFRKNSIFAAKDRHGGKRKRRFINNTTVTLHYRKSERL
jgi:hypothetical protein